ncbi:transposase [Bifidobacterium sp. SO4]|uniref:transposase n=1 Tax=Bifidobacterium sp. SO4 TaxID=2809030 RepID=UPI001BDC065E|nr:transposase [Bifidobacterium sp. SO4]MBT1169581.1 transposase [Bifidobacterium sp. SO4]
MSDFTPEQIRYLESLPAVESATPTRVYYTNEFRADCLRQYALGRRPVSIFRDAGLDPRLVGYKRIERAFARWKQAEHETVLPWERPADGAVSEAADGPDGIKPAVGSRAEPVPSRAGADTRDVLITQQIHYIQYLERELDRMRGLLNK